MKTKLFILFAAVAFAFGTSKVYAQATEDATPVYEDKVKLSVHVHPIQTLVIKNQKDVILEYKTKAHFKDGVSKNIADHIEIFSTGGFEIKAKTSNADLLGSSSNIKTIASSDIKLLATNGSKSLDVADMDEVELDGTNQVSLLTSEFGGVDKTFNVKYSAAGDNEYINHYVKGEDPTKYTTEVTYTIVAK